MKAVDFIVEHLIHLGVTDAFGLPGGVILDLVYAMERRKPELTPHLSYHEQGAVFAACGYAQTHGKLGVAYATRGPGVTNMITGIADAYYDSIPLLIITSHAQVRMESRMRIEIDQEMDPLPIVSGITKYAARVDRAEDVCQELERACHTALSGRKGPVLLDFYTKVFQEEIDANDLITDVAPIPSKNIKETVAAIYSALMSARRPILLLGDGIRQSGTVEQARQLAGKMRIPVLSSRAAQDVMPESPWYFGFIGSHGRRYSNFILSKADLILSIGNRMSFPVNSLSYRPAMERVKTIRIDIDEMEFLRVTPNTTNYKCDLKLLLPQMLAEEWIYEGGEDWYSVCRQLKDELWEYDKTRPVQLIAQILGRISDSAVITGDVGNHEFWLSQAYTYSGIRNRILYSKSFGALGCSLGKAIGAYYATRKPVVCFAGDQGFQLNIQELQFISSHQLPIQIVLINNRSSGMIRSREKQRYHDRFLHTTADSGYNTPDFKAIATAYGLVYRLIDHKDLGDRQISGEFPVSGLIEVLIDETFDLSPTLPVGNEVQNLYPAVPEELYHKLNAL